MHISLERSFQSAPLDTTLFQSDCINLLNLLLYFFKAALKKNLTPSNVREDLLHLGLSEEKADWLCSRWKANLIPMSRIAAGQTLTVNQLVDMEWRFGGI